jgi:hypothetical protein
MRRYETARILTKGRCGHDDKESHEKVRDYLQMQEFLLAQYSRKLRNPLAPTGAGGFF